MDRSVEWEKKRGRSSAGQCRASFSSHSGVHTSGSAEDGGDVGEHPGGEERGELGGGAAAQPLDLVGELAEGPGDVGADLGVAGGGVGLELAEQREAVADESG